ncbi:MAG: hypothetical protein ACK5KN_14305 [Dysgonomonas sp.]|uniref:hypothetical protein n=1 Tax=Dysgonomonas sp. TaxID=1891233 RepID=UPI003A8523E9
MKKYLYYCAVAALLMSMATLCLSCDHNIAGTYYYDFGDGGRMTYILNMDGTATCNIKYSKDATSIERKMRWTNVDGGAWLETGGMFEIIKDGYYYKTVEDCKTKRNGIKLNHHRN